eukprot:TRINITY_DN3830_c0_g1_i4.p1 TRINITY_DN3830_c0_g1~~TRINITY_DN3830_c0_g1_i4.p1  ORF type:complete len:226 (+),score=-34.34 TRINITY_DN3830_c0_g1_i4:683-1360(+)
MQTQNFYQNFYIFTLNRFLFFFLVQIHYKVFYLVFISKCRQLKELVNSIWNFSAYILKIVMQQKSSTHTYIYTQTQIQLHDCKKMQTFLQTEKQILDIIKKIYMQSQHRLVPYICNQKIKGLRFYNNVQISFVTYQQRNHQKQFTKKLRVKFFCQKPYCYIMHMIIVVLKYNQCRKNLHIHACLIFEVHSKRGIVVSNCVIQFCMWLLYLYNQQCIIANNNLLIR